MPTKNAAQPEVGGSAGGSAPARRSADTDVGGWGGDLEPSLLNYLWKMVDVCGVLGVKSTDLFTAATEAKIDKLSSDVMYFWRGRKIPLRLSYTSYNYVNMIYI